MITPREAIANVVFNELNQLITKNDIYDLLNEIILTDDTEYPLFRLIGSSSDSICYVCFTHNTVIVINALINYLNHSEIDNKLLAQDIFAAVNNNNDEIVYECFINTNVDDEYSPLISASNSSEVINIQRSLPNLSNLLEINENTKITRNEDNKLCLLCYDESVYCCMICKYPICENCVNIISNSSCKCPCCQSYPLKVVKITDD